MSSPRRPEPSGGKDVWPRGCCAGSRPAIRLHGEDAGALSPAAASAPAAPTRSVLRSTARLPAPSPTGARSSAGIVPTRRCSSELCRPAGGMEAPPEHRLLGRATPVVPSRCPLWSGGSASTLPDSLLCDEPAPRTRVPVVTPLLQGSPHVAIPARSQLLVGTNGGWCRRRPLLLHDWSRLRATARPTAASRRYGRREAVRPRSALRIGS